MFESLRDLFSVDIASPRFGCKVLFFQKLAECPVVETLIPSLECCMNIGTTKVLLWPEMIRWK